MQQDSFIDIFDKDQNLIATKRRSDVDKNEGYLRVVYIVVYNSSKEVFIVELKSDDPKKQYYQKYSVSAAGLVRSKEKIDQAAKRTLEKELGIDGELVFLGDFTIDNPSFRRFANFYCIKYDGDIDVNKDDVEKGEFVSEEMIENMVYMDKDLFTPVFLEFWERFRNDLGW